MELGRKIGVPTLASGAVFQRAVDNLDVKSNVSGITAGTGMSNGNIEFWPGSYSQANALGIVNASGTVVEILADDASFVEKGQLLLRVKPGPA